MFLTAERRGKVGGEFSVFSVLTPFKLIKFSQWIMPK